MIYPNTDDYTPERSERMIQNPMRLKIRLYKKKYLRTQSTVNTGQAGTENNLIHFPFHHKAILL